MPSQRFYFRPIDPGYGAMGAGLAQGISEGVHGYYDEKDRIRQREMEDARFDYEQATQDVELATMGGGRGEPPRPAGMSDLDFGRPGLARQTGPGNALTADIDLDPNVPPGPVAKAVADPNFDRYMEVGPEGFGYIERPDFRARRIAQEQQDIELNNLRAKTGRIGMALSGRFPDLMGNEISGSAALIAEGAADYNDLFDSSKQRWYPTTQEEAEDFYRFQQQNRRFAPRAGRGGEDDFFMTYDEAMDRVDELYPAEFDTDVVLSPAEKDMLARQLMTGEPVDWLPGSEEEFMEPPYEIEDPLAPIRVGPPSGREAEPPVEAELTPDFIRLIREELKDLDPGKNNQGWIKWLKESGFNEEQIKIILGT